MKINTVEMHQFHKYAHGLHISILKKNKLNQFGKYNTDVLIHTQLEICENRFKLQAVNFSYPRKILHNFKFKRIDFASKIFVMILHLYYKK